ncbi:MAG: hypothetical protein ACK50J_21725, partial [Planctomyces sp.]
VALQNRVIAAANGYDDASRSIENLTELTQKVAAQSAEVQVASQNFDLFVGLKDSVQAASAGIEVVRESVQKLAEVKNEILTASTDSDRAVNNAKTLVAMNERLGSESLRIDTAMQNLNSLETMQTRLSGQSEGVAAAIQNLEIMDDFQTEVSAHIRTLDGLRETLMEIAMMESTVGRVANVIQPLTEIGNLRRLSEVEVREAARVILDRRMTRFSQSEPSSNAGTSSDSASVQTSAAETQNEGVNEELVPLPPEARK